MDQSSVIFSIRFCLLMGFTGGSAGKESACKIGDLGSMPGLGRFPGEGNGYLLQDSGLEGHKELTGLSDFRFHFCLLITVRNFVTPFCVQLY